MSTICIPIAQGVPGLGGPPNWLDPSPLPTPVRKELDDPRWRGAASITYGVGTGEEAEFRALYHTSVKKSLYLSWRVKFDMELNNNLDALYVGLQPASGAPMIIKVTAYSSSGSDLEAAPSAGIQAMTRNADGTATPMADEPDWINPNTRVWLDVSAERWAIQMRVPIDADDPDQGVDLGNDFKMWYSLHVHTSERIGGAAVPEGVVMHNWPRDADVTTNDTTLQDEFPAPAGWGDFHLATGASDPACGTEGGVSLSYLDVGTTNTPTSEISYSNAEPVSSRPTNTIFARPFNDTGSAIPAGGITATFRLANWGSIADPNAPWVTIPGGSNRPNSASIPDGTKAGASNDIRFTWQLDNTDIANFITGKSKHQCMLVELSGAGLRFINNSVYRNMDFESASQFRRAAEINIVGLEAISGGGARRDVYLAVEKRNMPERVEPPEPGEEPRIPVTRAPVERPQRIPSPEELQRLAAKGDLTRERLDQIMPTYRVHMYYDTGKRIAVQGELRPILRPGSTFGYYVHHEGALYGWKDRLQGATEIASDFYKLAVPNNGTAKVTTTIEALETPEEERKGCLSALLNLIRAAFMRAISGSSNP